jgi:hypothetical protein
LKCKREGISEQDIFNGCKISDTWCVRPEIVRSTIPKDILVFNWFWKDPSKEWSFRNWDSGRLRKFHSEHKQLVRKDKKVDLQGGAPSSWASTNEYNFGRT